MRNKKKTKKRFKNHKTEIEANSVWDGGLEPSEWEFHANEVPQKER
jgi:hypothetical protein